MITEDVDKYMEDNKEAIIKALDKTKNFKEVASQFGLTWQKIQAYSKSSWGYYGQWRPKFDPALPGPVVKPVTNKKTKQEFSIEDFIDQHIKTQQMKSERTWEQDNIVIDLPQVPILMVGIGCLHVMGDGSNMARLRSDLEQINSLPNAYIWMLGDYLANTRNITRSGRGFTDEESLDIQQAVATWMFEKYGHKVFAMVMGNHDEWSYKSDGVSWGENWAEHILGGYLGFEGVATLRFIDQDTDRVVNLYRNWIAHTVKGYSMWNPTHGGNRVLLQRDPNLNSVWWSHIHNTAISQKTRQDGEEVLFIRSGGYQLNARYVKGWAVQKAKLAIPGAIYYPHDHTITPYFDFNTAVDVMEMYNYNYSKKELSQVQVRDDVGSG